MQRLDEEPAALLRAHQDAVQRLAAVPGLCIDSAQQIIAEVRPTARPFRRPSSWPPGRALVQGTRRVPASTAVVAPRTATGKMRRLLNQAAHAAVKTKGSIFELLYKRFVGRLGHSQAIGAIAHRLCRLVWRSCTMGS